MRTHSVFTLIDKYNLPLDDIRTEAWNSAKRRLEAEGSLGETFSISLTGPKIHKKLNRKEYTVEIKVSVE